MKPKYFVWAGAAIIAAVQFSSLTGVTGAQDQGVKALYDRFDDLGRRTGGKTYNVAEAPNWIAGSNQFTYRKSVKGGNEFVLVDPTAKTKTAPFDHAKLAASLTTAMATGTTYTATTLPFSTFTFANNRQAIEFSAGGGGGGRAGGGGGGGRAGGAPGGAQPGWRCTLSDYACTRVTPTAPQGQGGGGRAGGGGAGGGGRGGGAPGTAPQLRVSPDGKMEAIINNFNVFVRPVGATNGGTMLSTDGSEGNAYTFQSMRWSPDSKKIVAMRRRPGYERLVYYVESSPTDQLQPKHTTNFYRKPGDVMDFDVPVIFDVATKKEMQGDIALFPNPYQNTQLAWRRDSRAVTFEYNQRGHQLYRVEEIDATTGRTRTLIEEAQKTFVEYSGKKYRYDVADGKEIIWASERDGWNHLYLYDGATGQVKNQITKGNWVVRSVNYVDEAKRQIWFQASGMHAGKDPYLLQYYRVNFDGTGLTAFTSEDGTHTVYGWPTAAAAPPDPAETILAAQATQNRSPGEFYVDSWQRVDSPPQSVLKRMSDQSVVMELEKADITDLTATGWRMPEVFTSKARDGTTDIWGIIIRPTNFDPNKKYPVIENIYAGPQGSFVPKTFSTQAGMQAIAELGFIVVQIDGMGTSNRSKAFHDVAWQNLGDAGFPDRIIWHKAVAAKYAYYDTSRVGIYGTSAGGQNSLGALLFHPEFYKAAYSNSGCHDNRMDKIWWNEQWMGYPLGPHYSASSNVDNAKNLKGKLMLVVPELDTNVDPSSTMQVVNALIKASKEFELVVVPGANHGAASPITTRKRNDFFVRSLLGLTPPNWNDVPVSAVGNGTDDDELAYYEELERAPFFPDKD
jgi:dipeptidyl aminopeptidase/acylaminoacyl peptidase